MGKQYMELQSRIVDERGILSSGQAFRARPPGTGHSIGTGSFGTAATGVDREIGSHGCVSSKTFEPRSMSTCRRRYPQCEGRQHDILTAWPHIRLSLSACMAPGGNWCT